MRTEIKELHQRLATTSIYVTHDQIEAMTMGDQVVVMKDGRIEQSGPPLELLRPAGQPLRRPVHRLAGDEHLPGTLRRAGGALTVELADGSCVAAPEAAAAPMASR